MLEMLRAMLLFHYNSNMTNDLWKNKGVSVLKDKTGFQKIKDRIA
jgi:hypothetical protein